MADNSFTDYDAIGFDVDHTLAKYNLPHLFEVVHNGLADWLVTSFGYDAALKTSFSEHADFCCRGIVYDIAKGNFLKLSSDGYILRASHGTTPLTRDDITTIYGAAWARAEELVQRVDNLGDGDVMIMDNYFDMIGSVVIGRLVDLEDEKCKRRGTRIEDYRYIWVDVMAAYCHHYHYTGFQENCGAFFPAFRGDPSRFLLPCEPEVREWLRELRRNGVKLFVLTTSHVDFAATTLRYTLGDDWQQYFDMSLFYAKKPGFFYMDRPCYRIAEGTEKEEVKSLESGHIYSQGNVQILTEYLKKLTGKPEPKIAYVGDSLRSDLFPPRRHAGWDTVGVLEELEPLYPECVLSTRWGDFLRDEQGGACCDTLWARVLRKYARFWAPSLRHLARR